MRLGARWGGCLSAAAALVLSTSGAQAQAEVVPPDAQRVPWRLDSNYGDGQLDGDYYQILFTGGVRMTRGTLEIRGQSGLILLDREEFLSLREDMDRGSGLPRRSAPIPSARRQITEELLRERMRSFLQASGQADPAAGQVDTETGDPPNAISFDLFRYLYLEDGVTVIRDGLQVVRAERMFFSPAEDRMTLEGVELRLFSTNPGGQEMLITVRGDRILRSGTRWTGRDLSVTTCTAGEPHVEVISGELEIIEAGDQFLVRSRGNQLAFSGVKVLPLPDVSYFTSEQTNSPIQGASVGHSSEQGYEAELDLGGSLNDTGGAIHNFLTGRSAEEFRGDWNLGLGWIEERGFPTDLRFKYRGGDLYFGSMEGFYLDDNGDNIREIANRLDGSLIDNEKRALIRTENRVILGDGTDLDLTLWYASDPAVYSEFYGSDYRSDRSPETSAYLKSSADNRLFTVKGRFDLNDFSYLDNRAQAPFFVEQLPLATFDWFSEPILNMPWGAPLQLSSSTSFGQLERNFDSTLVAPMEDSTVRIDQEFEVASPFYLGPVGFRPWVSGRYTHYDNTVSGDSDERWAFGAGVSAGTRLSNTWSSLDSDGNPQSLRHIIAPRVNFIQQSRVDGDPTDFIPYDRVDALDEGSVIQLQMINILRRYQPQREDQVNNDFLYLDLTQNIHPNSNRDNNGSTLGLTEFEMILRPDDWLPVPNLGFLIEGEWDHEPDEMRTFNSAMRLRDVLGIDWFAEYRTDSTADGTIGYGVSGRMLDRWQIAGGSQYDLELNKNRNYSASLIRHDHDFSIYVQVTYDNISDETNFSINFEPTVGGLFRTRRQRSNYASRLYGSGRDAFF